MNTVTITKSVYDALPKSQKHREKNGRHRIVMVRDGVKQWVYVTWTR